MSSNECTPLLRSPREGDSDVMIYDSGNSRKELWLLFQTTIPVMAAYTLQNSIQTATVVVTGRLGPDELSAAAFAMMLATVTGWCLAFGGTTALDTLGSQAFTYSGKKAFRRPATSHSLCLYPMVSAAPRFDFVVLRSSSFVVFRTRRTAKL